jgi:hypothetical protein
MGSYRARGWRRIATVLSVIWFAGFGLYLWHVFVNDAVAPYAADLKICGFILDSDNSALQYFRVEGRGKQQDANFAKYQKCNADAKAKWERTRPDDRLLAPVVVGVDLASIGIGWLLVWFVVLIARWVGRGFASR